MSVDILWEENGLRVTLSGDLANDFLDMNNALIEDPRSLTIKYQIFDFTSVTQFPIDSNVIRAVAESDQKFYLQNPDIKLAIIANQTVMSGLVNMYKTYFELAGDDATWDTEIFENERDARLWINV